MSRSSKSPENPIKNLDESSSVMKQASSSSRESSSPKQDADVLWGSTEHLSDRRFKNSQRGKRVIPIAGEDPAKAEMKGRIMTTLFMIQG